MAAPQAESHPAEAEHTTYAHPIDEEAPQHVTSAGDELPPRRMKTFSVTPQFATPAAATNNNKKMYGLPPTADDIDSVVVYDLHWWTADRDLIAICDALGIKVDDRDVTFMEHKVNGKSKGQAVIFCQTKNNAIMLDHWLQHNNVQGKRIPATLASSTMGNPLHPRNQDNPAPRPLSAALHHNVYQATNSHGGVNFNRVSKTTRVSTQPELGVGHPSAAARRLQRHQQHQQQAEHLQPHQAAQLLQYMNSPQLPPGMTNVMPRTSAMMMGMPDHSLPWMTPEYMANNGVFPSPQLQAFPGLHSHLSDFMMGGMGPQWVMPY